MKTDEMVEILEGIIRDEKTNPTARCTAIRTLLRIEDDVGSRELDEEFEQLLHDDDGRFAELDKFGPRRQRPDGRR